MIAIFYFFRNYWMSISFGAAFIFFLMDMSGLIGNIGYIFYYPIIFIFATYCLLNNQKTSFIYILYICVCFLSIILNEIPAFYSIEFRFITFIILLLAFSPLVNSRSIALLRLRLLYFVTILSVILVFINFLLFQIGAISETQMKIYERTGMYFGSTANNEFATLGAISIMYIITFLVSFFKRLKIIDFIILLFLMFCCISMMLIASSRTALIGTILSIIFIAIYSNKNNFKQILLNIIVLVVLFTIAFTIFSNDMRGIIEYKQAGDMNNINLRSRENIWDTRIREFKSSPMYGIGFATISNPTKYAQKRGVIEAGSGWLSVLSQTGILGCVCMLLILAPNILFLLKNKNKSYCFIWLVGLSVIFLISPISEAYITTVGAVLCCLFWLNISIIDSFRNGLLKSSDLDLFLLLRKEIYAKRFKALHNHSLHSEH